MGFQMSKSVQHERIPCASEVFQSNPPQYACTWSSLQNHVTIAPATYTLTGVRQRYHTLVEGIFNVRKLLSRQPTSPLCYNCLTSTAPVYLTGLLTVDKHIKEEEEVEKKNKTNNNKNTLFIRTKHTHFSG